MASDFWRNLASGDADMDLITASIITLAIGLIAYTFLQGPAMQNPPSDLVTFAQNAGFTGSDAQTAAAIAIAESGGNAQALGDYMLNGQIVADKTPGSIPTSIGLWQIHYTVHPEFDQNMLTDPQYNANAAYSLYSRKGDFTDWTAYNTGKYLQYLDSNGMVLA